MVPIPIVAFGQKDAHLSFRLSGTRLIAFDYNPVAAIAGLNVDCAGKFGVTCGNPCSESAVTARHPNPIL